MICLDSPEACTRGHRAAWSAPLRGRRWRYRLVSKPGGPFCEFLRQRSNHLYAEAALIAGRTGPAWTAADAQRWGFVDSGDCG